MKFIISKKLNRMKKSIIFLIFIFFNLGISLQGQTDKDKSFYYDYGEHFFVESYSFPSQSPDSQIVVTIFRFSNSIIPFTKGDINASNDNSKSITSSDFFISYPIVFVEYRDSQGIIRRRDTWENEIIAYNYDETKNKMLYNYGIVNSLLPDDDYTIDVELINQERVKSRKIKIPILKKNTINRNPGIGEPIFSYRFNNEREENFQPYLLNKNIGFGSEDCHIFLLVSYYNEFEKYHFLVENKEIKDNKQSWDGTLKFSGIATPKINEYLNFIFDKSGRIVLSKIPFPQNLVLNENLKIGSMEVVLGADKLVPGKYVLKVWSGSLKDTLKFDFSIIWNDMPLSLKNPDYATEMMYYILTDDEYKEIRSGSSAKVFKKILDYWNKRDPTPNTLYNEAMTEYFRRVDYAFFNFQTTVEKDGAKTDRGKIYILYGKPDVSDRKLEKENQTVEIWRYKKLKKEFVFQTNSAGKLQLKKINDI